MEIKYTKDYGVRQGKKNGAALACLFSYIYDLERCGSRSAGTLILNIALDKLEKVFYFCARKMWSDHFLTVR